jgi:hypothetical protein
MEVEESLGLIERRIVTGMITSKPYLDEIVPMFKPDYVQSDEIRIIAKWCVEYYQQYTGAPGKHIGDIYALKKRDNSEAPALDMLHKLIESLADNYEPDFNLPFLLDETETYFRKRNMILLAEDLEGLTRSGDVLEAEKMLAEHTLVQRSTSSSVSITDPDANVVERAFKEALEPLIVYPGKLGRYVNDELTREAFVALMGSDKVGKTWMLLEMGIKALRSGSNVAFFGAGDMTETQILRRIGINQCGRSDKQKFCGELWVPQLDCIRNQTGQCDLDIRLGEGSIWDERDPEVIHNKIFTDLKRAVLEETEHKPCHECSKHDRGFPGALWYWRREPVDPITWKDAYLAMIALGKHTHRNFKLFAYPNGTLTIQTIESELEVLMKREGWTPDVVIIDYADIMDMGKGGDEREKNNRLWMAFRALSQKRRCLVLTATQADAKSYTARTLTRSNFSEDKRKMAHVTAMLGLQCDENEKKKGLLRLNRLVAREDEFYPSQCVTILQRLEMGKPFLGSF